MQKMIMYALLGGGVYWWFFMRPNAVVPPVTGGPVTTTGAPQPQAVEAYPRNTYDLEAFPMGSFADRR